MKFYFNTPDQINGDLAFNAGNYEEALAYYLNALETLNRHAASQSKQLHTDFYDAFVHVLADILATKAELIINKEDFANIEEEWQPIPGMLQEMEIVYHGQLSSKTNIVVNEETLKTAYSALAEACEIISDEIIDIIDNDENGSVQNLPSSLTLSKAIMWMQSSLMYCKKASKEISLACHLGYLNLLERQYKSDSNGAIVEQMARYIEDEHLFQKTITEPLEKLELLSYALLITVTRKQDSASLIKTCEEILDTITIEDEENQIVTDLLELIKLERKNSTIPEFPMEARDDMVECIYPEEDVFPTAKKDCKFQTTLDELTSSDEAMDLSSNVPPAVLMVGPPIDISSLTPVPMSCPTPEQRQVMSPLQEMSLFSQDSRLPTFSTMMLNPLGESNIPSFHIEEKKRQQVGLPSQEGLFARSLFPTPSLQSSSYYKAFIAGFEKIISNNNTADPKYVANLLSLIADFFREYRATGIPKRDAILIAFDLYQHVLKIYSGHTIATEYSCYLLRKHKKILRPYEHFGSHVRPEVNSSRDPRLPFVSKTFFKTAVEEVFDQMDTLLATSTEHIITNIKGLLSYVGDKLAEGAITKTPRPEIREKLFTAYKAQLNDELKLTPTSTYS
ncbi:hypothetical protein [Legionella brunensis]|uniref:Uncharacterized protein n=1 Tax=Legionella brunensis TaxID=29422 RepID=A0A0W0SUL1_9GAMM|nr:hypothetical protein [Legionella brunensis]KTC87079.1 hypothetical protein Lbru_0308 [Legionella brunensis]